MSADRVSAEQLAELRREAHVYGGVSEHVVDNLCDEISALKAEGAELKRECDWHKTNGVAALRDITMRCCDETMSWQKHELRRLEAEIAALKAEVERMAKTAKANFDTWISDREHGETAMAQVGRLEAENAELRKRGAVVTEEMFVAAQTAFNAAKGWHRPQPEKMRAALEAALSASPAADRGTRNMREEMMDCYQFGKVDARASDRGTRDAGLREAIDIIQGGSFLHDQAPTKLWANQLEALIRARIGQEPALPDAVERGVHAKEIGPEGLAGAQAALSASPNADCGARGGEVLPAEVVDRQTLIAKDIANLWCDGSVGAATCVLAALLRAARIGQEPALHYAADAPGHTDLMITPEAIDEAIDAEDARDGLTTPFKPCVMHFQESQTTEFIQEDVMTVWQEYEPGIAAGYAIDDRRLVGVQWPLLRSNADVREDIARLVAALEEIRHLDQVERRTCVDFDPAGCTYDVEMGDGRCASVAARVLAEVKGKQRAHGEPSEGGA